ncbi:unnamed protein product [Cylindrotheca closterium]|uniref:Uncharacterized protein n=1 Tax=Cylindrotheca closterium TaxID=2856 RepID=A0AAD2FHG5_9STRA|nr:unnamed protein product [Cylindrotheca closterium]
MSTIQRLAEADVRAIFDSLHGAHPPPEGLKFQIIPVGPSGLKLSPPAIEFDNGLYVLLRPEKKDQPKPQLPTHLRQYLAKEIPGQACPWSLSGPQFSQPTELQQRYCYPKGNPSYSSQKGGALWTMYDNNGHEDLNYRLLHVYFSAKRAGIRSATPSPARRRRRITTPTSTSSSASSSRTKSPATPNVVPTSPWPPHGAMPPRSYWQPHHHHHHHHPHYPMVPASLVHPTPPPMRPIKHYLTPPPPPPSSSAFKRRKFDIPTPPPTRSMMMSDATFAATTTTAAVNYNSVDTGRDHVYMEKGAAAKMPTLLDEDEDAWWMMGATGGAILEAPELGLLDHEDEMAIRSKLSFELLPLATVEDSRMDNLFLLDSEECDAQRKMAENAENKKDASPCLGTPSSLQKRLEVMHRQVLDWIGQQPKDKQPRMHQMVRQWAQKLQSELQLEEAHTDEDGDKKMAATVLQVPAVGTPCKKESPPVMAVAATPIKMESTSADDASITPSRMESV